jgi:hypothetical protein
MNDLLTTREQCTKIENDLREANDYNNNQVYRLIDFSFLFDIFYILETRN